MNEFERDGDCDAMNRADRILVESHLTVAAFSAARRDQFTVLCNELAAKPIWIELARGAHAQQPMLTKQSQFQSVGEVFQAIERLRCAVEVAGFQWLRTKLEVPALASGTPQLEAMLPLLNSERYFEWHGRVPYSNAEKLLAVCDSHCAHLSRNALADSLGTRFITLREKGKYADFLGRVQSLCQELNVQNWSVEKSQFEYCIFDSNVMLDHGWLRA